MADLDKSPAAVLARQKEQIEKQRVLAHIATIRALQKELDGPDCLKAAKMLLDDIAQAEENETKRLALDKKAADAKAEKGPKSGTDSAPKVFHISPEALKEMEE